MPSCSIASSVQLQAEPREETEQNFSNLSAVREGEMMSALHYDKILDAEKERNTYPMHRRKCTSAHMHVCLCVCLRVCLCLYALACVHTHLYMCMCAHTQMCMRVPHACACADAYAMVYWCIGRLLQKCSSSSCRICGLTGPRRSIASIFSSRSPPLPPSSLFPLVSNFPPKY